MGRWRRRVGPRSSEYTVVKRKLQSTPSVLHLERIPVDGANSSLPCCRAAMPCSLPPHPRGPGGANWYVKTRLSTPAQTQTRRPRRATSAVPAPARTPAVRRHIDGWARTGRTPCRPRPRARRARRTARHPSGTPSIASSATMSRSSRAVLSTLASAGSRSWASRSSLTTSALPRRCPCVRDPSGRTKGRAPGRPPPNRRYSFLQLGASTAELGSSSARRRRCVSLLVSVSDHATICAVPVVGKRLYSIPPFLSPHQAPCMSLADVAHWTPPLRHRTVAHVPVPAAVTAVRPSRSRRERRRLARPRRGSANT